MQRHADELRLQEVGRAVGDWALGLGLLRVHLAAFTVGAVALVMTDLYRSPADLRVDGWLRLWAVALGCHTAALLAGWATWRAVRPHRLVGPIAPEATSTAATAVARPGPVAAGWPLTEPGRNGRSPNGPAGSVSTPANVVAARLLAAPVATERSSEPPMVAPLPSRGRFSPPTSAPPTVGHGGLPHLQPGDAAAKLRATAAGAAAAGRTGWQRLAGVTRSSAVSIRHRLMGSDTDHPDVHPGGPPPGPPGWPPSPEVSPNPPGWDGVVAPPTSPGGTVGAAAPAGATGWPVAPPGHHDPVPMATPQPTRPENPPAQSATEWTWMEAAAASWLARRDAEADQPPTGSSAAPAPPAVPAPSPPATGDAGGSPAPR